MKRIMLAVVGASSVATAVEAQATYLTLSNEELIARAVLAAPPAARESATVVKWNADNTYTVIRQGTGAFVCYDHSGGPGERPFAVQCTNPGNLPRVKQNYELEARAAGDRERLRQLLDEAEANGTRVAPEFGSVFMSLTGNDPGSASLHTTIAVPFATQATIGFPENRNAGGGWIMDAGTSTAHIMIPGF